MHIRAKLLKIDFRTIGQFLLPVALLAQTVAAVPDLCASPAHEKVIKLSKLSTFKVQGA
jgi:hypothetical protein